MVHVTGRRPLRRQQRRPMRPQRENRMTKSVVKGLQMYRPLFIKRTTTSRLMTLISSASSAGSITFNSGTNITVIATPASIGVSYHSLSLGFCLTDLPNVSEFTTLFDDYKICGIALKIYPLATNSNTESTAVSDSPQNNGWLHHITDDNDYSGITASDVGIDAIRQYANYRVVNLARRKPIKRYIKPKIAIAGYDGVTTSSIYNTRPQWINTGSTSVPHYAWKGCFEIYNNADSATYQLFKIEATYYVGFKNWK